LGTGRITGKKSQFVSIYPREFQVGRDLNLGLRMIIQKGDTHFIQTSETKDIVVAIEKAQSLEAIAGLDIEGVLLGGSYSTVVEFPIVDTAHSNDLAVANLFVGSASTGLVHVEVFLEDGHRRVDQGRARSRAIKVVKRVAISYGLPTEINVVVARGKDTNLLVTSLTSPVQADALFSFTP
jgi:hypothetical protein